jgi:hypothetical protein
MGWTAAEPPGLSTRATSSNTAAGSGTVHNTNVLTTVSTDLPVTGLSSTGVCSMSAVTGDCDGVGSSRRAICRSGSVSTRLVTADG